MASFTMTTITPATHAGACASASQGSAFVRRGHKFDGALECDTATSTELCPAGNAPCGSPPRRPASRRSRRGGRKHRKKTGAKPPLAPPTTTVVQGNVPTAEACVEGDAHSVGSSALLDWPLTEADLEALVDTRSDDDEQRALSHSGSVSVHSDDSVGGYAHGNVENDAPTSTPLPASVHTAPVHEAPLNVQTRAVPPTSMRCAPAFMPAQPPHMTRAMLMYWQRQQQAVWSAQRAMYESRRQLAFMANQARQQAARTERTRFLQAQLAPLPPGTAVSVVGAAVPAHTPTPAPVATPHASTAVAAAVTPVREEPTPKKVAPKKVGPVHRTLASGWTSRRAAPTPSAATGAAPKLAVTPVPVVHPVAVASTPASGKREEGEEEDATAVDSWDESDGEVAPHPQVVDQVPSAHMVPKPTPAVTPCEDELGLGTALNDSDRVMSFHDMGISAELLRGVEALGYTRPSRVQSLATVPMVNGRDTIAQAPPGQGKTGAFAIGALSQVDVASRDLQVVVVSPSKELCLQTARVFTTLGQHMRAPPSARSTATSSSHRRWGAGPMPATGARVEAFVGGIQSVGDNLRALRRHPHVIVGCSGRLCQLQREGLIDMSGVRVIVLDEADELVEGSQAQDVACLVRAAPSNAQIGLFSATMPEAAIDVARTFMNKPVVSLTRGSECAGSNVEHCYVAVPSNRDYVAGVQRLAQHIKRNGGQTMVFVRRRSEAEDVAAALVDAGVEDLDAVHSGVDRAGQRHVLASFAKGTCRVLVCTDMLARGFDVPAVSTVVNVGLPSVLDRYVHRAGRCGRYNRRGTCISVLSERSLPRLDDLKSRYGARLVPFHE